MGGVFIKMKTMKNAKNGIATLFFLFSVAGMAQVGIGTPAPAATLDITAANLTAASVDGLLVPRISRARAQTMAGTPTSTLVYIDNVATGSLLGTTVNVTSVGFYFFNGTVWERLASGANNAWNITGNAGLSGTTNFLGTTDPVDLAFRRNNSAAGKIGATSTGFGVNALTAGAATTSTAFGTDAARLTTGNANTSVGYQALYTQAGAANATAMGYQTLLANTAAESSAFGSQAMMGNIGGTGNTAMGFQALLSNANGSQNTAVGNQAARGTTGSSNTAIGYQTLYFNTTGINNTAIGRHAMHLNTASNNTAVGQQALLNNTTATGNTAVGSDALRISTGAGNTAVGYAAGEEHGTGANNTYLGLEAGRYNTGAAGNNVFAGYQSGHRSTGSFNTILGSATLRGTGASSNNVAVGYNIMTAATTATNNTALGSGALSGNVVGNSNVAIGYQAGATETGDQKLYIENSNAGPNAALIYGEFNTNIVRVNGQIQVGNPTIAGYAFPTVRGTNGQILQTDGAGATNWVSPSALSITETDPQVSSTTTGYVPRWNGTTLVDGVVRDDATNVGIGVAPSAGNRLDVNGNTRTTNFQMTSGAADGYLLQSDAAGNGTWVPNAAANLSMVNANLTANQVLTGAGWEKINFDNETFDTASEFNITNGRFRASKAGFYRINAAYHTNPQSHTNLYSIGVYVNGTLHKMSASDHHGIGQIERSVSCLVPLAVNDYVEIYIEDYVAGVEIDGYSGKTYFEVQQAR